MGFSEKQQLYEQYEFYVLRKQSHTSDFEILVKDYLNKCLPHQRLCDETASCIDRAVWEPTEVAQAFRCLERYALNILKYPWKSEFKTLKVDLT